MKQYSFDEETVRHQFDSYCKKILKGEACNYRKELARHMQHEITISELSEKEMSHLYTLDKYSVEYYFFQVRGFDVEVKDSLLGEALETLTEKNRNIILLSYFMDMSDEEIGQIMSLVRSTIYRQRKRTLQEIKLYLEGKYDE